VANFRFSPPPYVDISSLRDFPNLTAQTHHRRHYSIRSALANTEGGRNPELGRKWQRKSLPRAPHSLADNTRTDWRSCRRGHNRGPETANDDLMMRGETHATERRMAYLMSIESSRVDCRSGGGKPRRRPGENLSPSTSSAM